MMVSRSGARMTETRSDVYGYNDRSELTNAVKNATLNEYAYQYDDIGNRLASLDLGDSRVYQANSLNQYTSISNAASTAEAFVPQFDLDGNQTLVRTTTGDWSVTYNGENRPVSWSCGATNIVMSFDRMGRRVEYLETTSAEESIVSDGETNLVVTVTTNAHYRFVYDGYLCIQWLNALSNNAVDLAFGWDPTEPVATRPIWMQRVSGTYNFFYFHDGSKNVSELVSYQAARGVPAHYEYAPFGALTAATTNTAFTAFNVAEVNPYRFSSEYADDALGLVYYNYRHYEPVTGRWLQRDPAGELATRNLMMMLFNNCTGKIDGLGLCCCGDCQIKKFKHVGPVVVGFRFITGSGKELGVFSFEKILDDLTNTAIDEFIKEYGGSLIKSVYEFGKEALDQKSKWETIGSFLISTGFLIQPQVEVATKISYYRRDCARDWWQFWFSDCKWNSWKRHTDTQSEWVAPKEEIFGDSQFTFASVVSDPESVFRKIRDDLRNIKGLLDEKRGFDVDGYKFKLGCETVEQ